MKNSMSADKRYILNFTAWSLGYIVMGLVLLLAPEHGRWFICYLIGGGAVALGIGRIVWYFAKDDVSRAFHNDIPYGVVLLILGVYLIVRPEAVYNWLPVILGFAVVYDSIIKLQHAFDLKRTGFAPWCGVLLGAIVTAVLGVLLIMGIVGKTILLYYFGAVLLADGVMNLFTIAMLTFRTRKKGREDKDEGEN